MDNNLPAPFACTPAMGNEEEEQAVAELWEGQKSEVEQVSSFRTHPFPVGKIHQILDKKEKDIIRPVPVEVPVLLAKACELFAKELTLRTWMHTVGSKRRVLRREDLVSVIVQHDMYGFLVDDDAKGPHVGYPSLAVPRVPPPHGFHLFGILLAGDLRRSMRSGAAAVEPKESEGDQE